MVQFGLDEALSPTASVQHAHSRGQRAPRTARPSCSSALVQTLKDNQERDEQLSTSTFNTEDHPVARNSSR